MTKTVGGGYRVTAAAQNGSIAGDPVSTAVPVLAGTWSRSVSQHSLARGPCGWVVTDANGLGFQTVTTEFEDVHLEVDGTIPDWLTGTFIRNGPGKFEAGDTRVNHWFDGLAMLRRYAFADGAVRYSNRFLRTEAYADAVSGRLTGQFGTDTRGWQRVFETITSAGLPEPTDNANVHIARLDGEFVALTEAPRRMAFDSTTLETRGEFRFDDDLPEHVTAAHLVDDPHRGETVGFSTEFGLQPRYHLYRIQEDERTRDHVGAIDASGPAYIHDCSVTADHIVIVETPLVMSALRALSPLSEGAMDILDWQPERPTRVLVVDRETGTLVADPTLPAVFSFHHVNAYCAGTDVVLDLIEFPDGDVVDALSMANLDGAGFPAVDDGRLMRYRIDTTANTVRRHRLYDGGMEFPRVMADQTAREHRYVYGQATDRDGANGLVKVDCVTGEAREWWERSTYVEEPVPVQRPGTGTEDDGVVLATALDLDRERTVLLVFDAATLTVRARVPLPHAEPFGFHGRFFPAEQSAEETI